MEKISHIGEQRKPYRGLGPQTKPISGSNFLLYWFVLKPTNATLLNSNHGCECMPL